MLQDARRRLELLIGRRTAFPPPPVPQEPAALRAAVSAWHEGSAARYGRIFVQGKPLLVRRAERDLFVALERAGLVERLGPSIYQPCVRLLRLYGRFVATDLLSRREPDQVFSLMFEQVYFVRNFDVRPQDEVLELCLGSGVNSLFAADVARAVTGVDVSARALAFARFNQAFNPGAVPIEMLEGALFEPLAERRFDTILVNPPFELVPREETWFLHSDGGEDGLDVMRTILADAPRHLAEDGRFQVVTWSPAAGNGPLLVALLRAAFPDHRITVHVLDVAPLDAHVKAFRTSPHFPAFRERLAERGLEDVYFLYVHTAPSNAPGVEITTPTAEAAACHGIADTWI